MGKVKGKCFKFKRIRLHVLVLNDNNELEIINLSNQDTPLSFGYIPLFNIDLWEHAYYLNYENDRSKYIDNFEKISDFSNAHRNYNNLIK